MGRALAAVGGLLVLCFAILGIVVLATRQEDRVAVDSVLAETLTRAIAEAQERGEQVDVSRYTRFEWDEMLLVDKDAPRSVLSRELGFEFKGDLPYDAESSDLLVFVADGELRRFADYRGRGVFVDVERPIARFSPQTAVFDVEDLVIRPTTRP